VVNLVPAGVTRHFITNFPQNVSVKKSFKINRSIFGKNMGKNLWLIFLATLYINLKSLAFKPIQTYIAINKQKQLIAGHFYDYLNRL